MLAWIADIRRNQEEKRGARIYFGVLVVFFLVMALVKLFVK
jgi:hypothetical protein